MYDIVTYDGLYQVSVGSSCLFSLQLVVFQCCLDGVFSQH